MSNIQIPHELARQALGLCCQEHGGHEHLNPDKCSVQVVRWWVLRQRWLSTWQEDDRAPQLGCHIHDLTSGDCNWCNLYILELLLFPSLTIIKINDNRIYTL